MDFSRRKTGSSSSRVSVNCRAFPLGEDHRFVIRRLAKIQRNQGTGVAHPRLPAHRLRPVNVAQRHVSKPVREILGGDVFPVADVDIVLVFRALGAIGIQVTGSEHGHTGIVRHPLGYFQVVDLDVLPQSFVALSRRFPAPAVLEVALP